MDIIGYYNDGILSSYTNGKKGKLLRNKEKIRICKKIDFIIIFINFLCYFLFISTFHFCYISWNRVRSLKAQPIPPELAAKLLGNRVAVSPIVTVEPRRRKFHKPISLTIPVPIAAGKGMINQYNNTDGTPTLRLLCSITGNLMFYKLVVS